MELSSDEWAHVVRHARRALAELPDALVTPEIARLRAVPPSRLAGGPSRRRLARVLATTPLLWRSVRERAAADAPPDLASWLRGSGRRDRGGTADGPEPAVSDETDAGLRAEVVRQKDRARGFRTERDDAVRQLEGAIARAEAAERRLAELTDELEVARGRVVELESEATDAALARQRAVDRERRRSESALEELREELRRLRRVLEERERALQAERDRASALRSAAGAPVTTDPSPVSSLVAGRPSRLPVGVQGTREEAALLLGRGRRVVVDGYNVTRTHRGQLSLEEQRAWLLRLLSGAAAARGIVPEVFFDGTEGSGPGGERVRGVAVTFSRDTSADDEIEFRVAALDPDEPVTVVTDDRELRERVRRYGADVIGTGPLLWVVG